MKKRIAIMLTVILAMTCCFTTVSFGATNPDVTVNGTFVTWTDASPFIDSNGRTLVPLRATMEACGLDVSWDAKNRIAIVTDGETTVKVPIDKKTIYINGKGYTIDTNAVIKGGRTSLPIRAVAEAFGYNVCWSSIDKLVSLIQLNYGLEFEMTYKGEYLGNLYLDTDGMIYIEWNDGDETEAAPTAMFDYDDEYILKSNTVLFILNDNGTSRVVVDDLTVNLRLL